MECERVQAHLPVHIMIIGRGLDAPKRVIKSNMPLSFICIHFLRSLPNCGPVVVSRALTLQGGGGDPKQMKIRDAEIQLKLGPTCSTGQNNGTGV